MAWQSRGGPETKLNLRLRPWSNTRLALKSFGVGLGALFLLTLSGWIYGLIIHDSDAGFFGLAALGTGLLFGLHLLVARLACVWGKL